MGGPPLAEEEFHCDNQSVCDIQQKGSTRQPEIMALVHMLYFCAARFDIHIRVTHIAGTTNIFADALSRSQMSTLPKLVHLPDQS